MEEIIVPTTCSNIISTTTNTNTNNKTPSTPLERKVRPEKAEALNCPRCNSTNTKFCYYNNYSLTQPRYFCKTCRRYWTEGGSLRNIPVGGGSRKNNKRRSSSSSFATSPNSSSSPSSKNPKIIHHHQHHQPQDLNLGFPTHHEFRTLSEFIHLPPTTMEAIPSNPKTQMPNSRGLLAPFMPVVSDPNGGYSAYLQDFKPTLNFSLDGLGIGNGVFVSGTSFQQEDQRTSEDENGRLLFPLFEDLKQVSSNNTSSNTNNTVELNEQKQGGEQHQSTGYWSSMLGMGGASW